jgi:hypothetical protein
MNDEPQPISPRVRLQQLQAIPDRQRTDAEWDELNELEIMLAAGNREGAPNPNSNPAHRRNTTAPANRPKPNGGPRGRKTRKKFHR